MTYGRTYGRSYATVYGIDRGGGTWTIDSTSNKALPANGTEGNALLAAAAVTGSAIAVYNFGAAAASPVPDDAGAKDLVGAGTLAFENTVTGWTAKAIKTTAGVAGALVNAADFDDIAATPYTVVLVAQLDIAATTRTLFRMGDSFDDDATIEQGPVVLSCGEGDGTRTSGVSAPTGDRIIMLSIGATVLVATDQEKVTVGTRACNGDELLFGGDNAQTWFPNNTYYIHAYVVDAALTFTGMKAVMEESGWTVPWSP